jgi:hypothetical protein
MKNRFDSDKKVLHNLVSLLTERSKPNGAVIRMQAVPCSLTI